jgi:hypothetical protein
VGLLISREIPMRKAFGNLVIAPGCLLVVVPLLVLTSCQPDPPVPVKGTFNFEITDSTSQSSGSMLTMSGSTTAVWEGSFEGTSTSKYEESRNAETGRGTYRDRVIFEGSVEGIDGTLKIHFDGKREDRESAWEGTWEILEGEGALLNLQGGGTFIEIDDENDIVDYTGQIQFEPKFKWQFWKAGE